MTRVTPPAYRHNLSIRVPVAFTEALRTVAGRRLMTVTSLVRHLLAEELRSEGFDVAKLRDSDDEPRHHGASEAHT